MPTSHVSDLNQPRHHINRYYVLYNEFEGPKKVAAVIEGEAAKILEIAYISL